MSNSISSVIPRNVKFQMIFLAVLKVQPASSVDGLREREVIKILMIHIGEFSFYKNKSVVVCEITHWSPLKEKTKPTYISIASGCYRRRQAGRGKTGGF